MTAVNEESEERLPSLTVPALMMLLGFAAVYALVVNGLLSLNTFWGPQGRQASGAFAANLIVIGTIWGLSRLRPSRQTTMVVLVLLPFAALLGFGSFVHILTTSWHGDHFRGLRYWKSLTLLAGNALVFAGSIWGLWKLIKSWKSLKREAEPISPATRRTRQLFALSGVVGVLAVVALTRGANVSGNASALWSNSQNVSPGFAIAAAVIWLLSLVIAWWWYFSADEHEKRANDVGFLFGGGLFMAMTPIWWIGSRAGLLPPPDAMILWYVFVLAMGVGWFWYRSR